MSGRRRVAVVSRRVEGLSGAARLIVEHSRRLVRAGFDVSVLAERLDEGSIRGAGAEPVKVRAWPWGSWLKRRSFAWAAGRAAAGFDIVHGHGDLLDQDVMSLHNAVHAAHEAAKGKPLPETDAVGRMHALQLGGRRFKTLIVNSKLVREDVIRRFGVPAEMIEVVYPGFDPMRFKPTGKLSAGTTVGLITSGDFEKRGLRAFLKAFASVVRAVPDARALVVGKETRPGPYLALARDLGIADKVEFKDPIPEVERLYHSLDVYVHAARFEEFGMSVLEALGCGVPVVTAARVGAAELLSGEARESVLADPTPEALASAITALLKDPERRRRLAAAGPAAAAPCAWDRGAAAVGAVYERLLLIKK